MLFRSGSSSSAPSISPATGAFYVSTVTIDPKNDDPGVGRFKDALNLINGNRQEIIDRAFAEVSLQYNETAWGTNWVTPGDSASAAYNRFRDAYRLIQQNREEIRDRALLALATAYDESAWGTNWTFPGDTPTQSYSRYWDAVRLIQKNKQIIIETAYATVVANPPSPAPSNMLSKCKRDLGYFIDAVCMDIEAIGANRYTRKFVQQYFTGNTTLLTNGLFGEVSQSITAFNKARDAMKAAITNTLGSFAGVVISSPAGGTWQDGTTGSKTVYTDLTITSGPATYNGGGGNIANNNSAACADVRSAVDTLAAIVSTTLTAVDLGTLPAVNNGTLWQSGVNKCFRDLYYYIDAVSLDIAQSGGNRYSRKFVQKYFTNSTTPLSNGLLGEEAQSIVMFNAARDAMKKAVSNQLYIKDLTLTAGPATYGGGGGNITYNQSGNAAACADVQSAIDTLAALITAPIAAGNLTNLPAESRGYESRYDDAANLIRSNKREIVDRAVAEVANQYNEVAWGLNWVFPGDSTNQPKNRYYDSYRCIQQNRAVIVNNAFAEIAIQFPTFTNPNSAKCQRDIGFFIDAVSLDISRGGSNAYTRKFVQQYFNGSSFITNGLLGEETQSVAAFTAAASMMKAAITNTLGSYVLSNNTGFVGTVYTDPTLTADPSPTSGTVSNTNPNSCANVRAAIDTLTAIVNNAVVNRTTAGLPPENYNTSPSGEGKCRRDIGYLVDAVEADLRTGTNVGTKAFIAAYFSGNAPISNGLVGEEAQSIIAFNMARDMMKKALTNQLYVKNLTVSAGPATYGGGGGNITVDQSGNAASCVDVQNAVSTLVQIATDRIAAGNLTSAYSGRSYPADAPVVPGFGETKCRRDIGFLIDAVSLDISLGNSNRYSRKFIQKYFDNSGSPNSNGLVGEEAQSVVAFNMARDMMKKALTNQLYYKDLTVSPGPATYGGGGGNITVDQSGNAASCADVQASVDTLMSIITTVVTAGT